MCPILSQIVQGLATSFCYLGLSVAPAGTGDLWVSAVSSVYSPRAWSTVVTCSWLQRESIAWGDACFTQLSLLPKPCPMACSACWSLPQVPRGYQGEALFVLGPLSSRDTASSFWSSPRFQLHLSSLQSLMQSHWYVEWPSCTSFQLSRCKILFRMAKAKQ